MATEKTISGLIQSQLPDFINAKYQENAPSFRRFIELYYKWMESNGTFTYANTSYTYGNTVHNIMKSGDFRDIDTTEDGFLTLFKKELLPYFPERTELELTKILKGAKEFYLKKGTEESIKWLFRVLFNAEATIHYPRDNILRASDGKWIEPKSLKLSDTPFIIQSAASTQNLYSAVITDSTYHSNANFTTTVQFENDIRKTSTVIVFASYKVWYDVGNSGQGNFEDYVYNTNNSGTVVSSDGVVYEKFLTRPIVSSISFDLNEKRYFTVTEAFYTQNVSNSYATTLSYNPNMAIPKLRGIMDGAPDAAIQFDGVRAFEFGNLEKDSLIAVDSYYDWEWRDFLTSIAIDNANTPAYVFTFAKEDIGVDIPIDTANTVTIANGTFGADKYTLTYSKKYRVEDVNCYVQTTTDANIAVVSFAFKEKPRTAPPLLEKRKVTGLVSKATATVEKAFTRADAYTRSQYTELFISNIVGEFINNELVEVEYVDADGNTRVYTERIFGFVGAVVIDPNRRGFSYKVGDPVVIYGGTANGDSTSTAGFSPASAYVANVTSGRILSVSVTKGGYGYRTHPNTTISLVNDPTNPDGVEGVIQVGSVDTGNGITLSLATDTIEPYADVQLNESPFNPAFPANASSDISSTLTSCFSFESVTFYPISSLTLINGGHDYLVAPTLSVNTYFQINGTTNVSIASLGYIANVEVARGGTNYSATNKVIFTGSGSGANATLNVSGGVIVGVNVDSRGFGYTTMPSVTIETSTGSGAELVAYGFSDGLETNIVVDEVGKIQDIAMSSLGFGYTSTPEASLKVLDIYVSNLASSIQDDQTIRVYQGADFDTATFFGNVDINYTSINTSTLSSNNTLRVYDYNGVINVANAIIIAETDEHVDAINYKIYGNGLARANVSFVDGTVTYGGYFLNTDGFLSADKKLQDKNKYHNFSYVVDSNKQFKDYKQTIMNIVHPIGMEMIAHTDISDDHKTDVTYSNGLYLTVYRSDVGYINAGPMVFADYYKLGANALFGLGTANAVRLTANTQTTDFSTLGFLGNPVATGSRVIINYDNTYRKIVTTVSNSPSASRLNISQPVIITGHGKLTLNGSVYAVCSENVAGRIVANDYLRIFDAVDYDVTGTDTHVLVRRVAASPTNNIIQLTATASLPVKNTALGYLIDPDLRNAPIKIERDLT